MIQRASLWVLLPLALLGAILPAAGGKAKLVPRWEAKVTPPTNPHANMSLTVTPDLVLVQSEPGVVAHSRATGKELWRKTGAQQAGQPMTYESWRVLGAGPGGAGAAVLLLTTRRVTADRRSQVSTRIEAVEAESGRQRWQEALATDEHGSLRPYPQGVYGGVLVLIQRQGTPPVFRDAATGDEIDPAGEAGREALRRAAARHGTPWVALQGYTEVDLLDLRSGTVRQLPMPHQLAYLHPQAVFLAPNRLIAHLDMDDDGAGHSLWPKYLLCTDRNGKAFWRFPQRRTTASQAGTAPSSLILRALYPPKSGTVVAEDEMGRLHGVRLRNGSVAWRKQLPQHYGTPLTATTRGFYMLANPRSSAKPRPDHASLAYVDADSGRLRWLGRVPPGNQLAVNGNDLFLLSQDRVRAYRTPRVEPSP